MAFPLWSKLVDTVVDKGASLISEFITDKDEAARLEHAFRSQVSAENHEIKQLEIEAERDMHNAQQATVQAELHQSDLYTKRTRPKIARQSWYVTAAYALLMLALDVFGRDVTFQWEIFLVLSSPALTYMGVRGFEKWKAGGSR